MPGKSRDPLPFRPRSRGASPLADINALALKELLDEHFDDVDISPYRALYAQVREAALARRGDSVVRLAELLDQIDDMCEFEGAVADAGFVLGFECCRQLLLGELDLRRLKRTATPSGSDPNPEGSHRRKA
jgi:hypothetical protein